ncbi:MAG: hypothetical protein JWO03_1639 [Bacteroidetes bacterium]|nr:hypothetical protein [Bacteroidota bacterium]
METNYQQSQVCTVCTKELNIQELSCPFCTYPVRGEKDEQDRFMSTYNSQRSLYQNYMTESLKATKSLYWLSGASVVGNMIMYAVTNESNFLIAAFLVPIVFIPLALWSRTNPFPALLTALILYILIILTDAIGNPAYVSKGAVFKVFIIIYLVKGVNAGYKSKKLWAELTQKRWTQEF